ncbi:aminopeptidase N [Methylovirgula sp. 4M-Z18]|uniref:aminopeptidase N n=1 Tax=Methylovirgula sp. 4M-Z18 TaxID=2293567 RepID=UPI000E2EB698|nr:aminopeptidase N [Methylovirgula sp. 4M-Z18]RFB78426.1 aminopeptidase N [Methylovirgula sp. 4M-Z18]
MRPETGHLIRLSDYLPPDYLIDTVDLDIKLDRHATHVRALLAIRPNPKGRAGAPLRLDGDELKATRIALNGIDLQPTAGFVTPDQLVIEKPPQEPFTLQVETVLDPAANTKFTGLYRSGSAYCTQCEAEGFRRITYFLDRPDVLSVYTTRIEADKAEAPVLLGNGNRQVSGDVPGTSRHFAVWHDPHPKPSYLFALVGGDLGHVRDSYTTKSGTPVELGIYVEKGKEARAAYAMDALKRSMRWDEDMFGREYDLDVFNIVAVSDFNMGAMENKGLNVFNDKYVLASSETATDADYAGIETVIAHEYFHNWTGNRITCRDWFQLCLKEGLTVFRDQEFSSDERSRTVKRIADVRTLRAAQFPEDSGPLAHNVRPDTYREINNFYTATVYNKGAEVIRMLKRFIGDKAFADGMALYFERFDGTAATVENFLSCFADASQRDLTQFKRWYEQAGTPLVSATSAYDAAAQTLTVDLKQSTAPTPGQSEKKPFVIPLSLGLIDHNGGAIALASEDAEAAELQSGTFILKSPERRITFRNVASKPVVSLLRNFSAPVRLQMAAGPEELLALLAHDSDGFNRWQAVQTYATDLLVQAVRSGEPTAPIDPRFIAAMDSVLVRAHEDPALAAQILALPSETDIAREIAKDIDPDAIFAARDHLQCTIGLALQPALTKIYAQYTETGAYSPDALSAGRRALRNSALAYLAAGDKALGLELAKAQFDGATNMTNRLGAAAALATLPGAARETMLKDFYARFADDALVIDKWFTLQATIPEAETLERVKGLMAHEAFSLANPNRTRALIGAFATGNQTQFHRADGAGYELVIDVVARLDATNPQVAARMLSAFRTWRTMDAPRQTKAEAALLRLKAKDKLSNDVADILTRTLA